MSIGVGLGWKKGKGRGGEWVRRDGVKEGRKNKGMKNIQSAFLSLSKQCI